MPFSVKSRCSLWSSSISMVPSVPSSSTRSDCPWVGNLRRQRVADAEIDHRAIGERHDRPGRVVRAVAGVPENAVLAARHDFHRPIALQEPAHQVHVIGEHVQHRRGVGIALEDGESLRARVVDPRESADHLPEAAVDHLLLGPEKAFLVAAAVADAQLAAGRLERSENVVGVLQRQRDRFLAQHRLAELERPAHWRGVLALGR